MASLVWNGVTITDWYHLAEHSTGNSIVKDIVFPLAVGRDVMMIGQQFGDDTSRYFRFAEEGVRRNRIAGASVSALITIINSLQTARVGGTLGTLTFNQGLSSFSETNMRLVQFNTAGAFEALSLADSAHAFLIQFDALFVKYA